MPAAPSPSPVPLRPPSEPLDPRVRTWWRGHALAWPGGVAVVLLVLAALIPSAASWLALPGGTLLVLAVVAALVLPAYGYRVHRWEVSDEAVYTRSGFLFQEWRAAPVSRVQTVDTTRGPWQRRLGLATLVVTTASAKGAVTVAGLDDEHADELARRLTRTTAATPGDAV